ncbi:AAA family ATPase [Bradyrhizobium sp. LjRoot220]|uniref:AAA family ATPase n=1 Tax=Bradyrhizobium sp. LjRoot220 TaxID=3342284 RepID=UPI003ECCCA23
MRLDKLTIGSAIDGPNQQFKNLKNVSIDFDQDQWVTVVIGWNGTGKSNVLEALAIIFRDLIGRKRAPEFAYQLSYRIGRGPHTRCIQIDANPDRVKDPYIIDILSEVTGPQKISDAPNDTQRVKLNAFLADDRNLPRYIFCYYSGESTRMQEVFRPYLEGYDSKLRNGEDPGLKRLFYAMPVHSQFVLLAFLIQQTPSVQEFLDHHLGLDPEEGIESVLFVIRQPPWTSRAADGDRRFWNARGIVRDFLAKLFDISLAPIRVKRRVPTSLWNEKELEFQYLYVKDLQALRSLVGESSPAEFFRDLESTYVSELIDEVRIRVRLKKNDGSVTFRELSEGEQQLLTVLGLLRFTAENESLLLLDEPDTHLNPRWCVDYLSYLKTFVGSSVSSQESSHIVLTTHNPLAVAELVKEQVQILRIEANETARTVVACYPEMDPRGMGYGAIVTSDMFGIASSLDKPTQLLLEAQRSLAGKDALTADEQVRLDSLNAELDRLGFRFFYPDDEYSRYLRLRNEALQQRFQTEMSQDLIGKAAAMTRDDKEELASRLVNSIIRDDDSKE